MRQRVLSEGQHSLPTVYNAIITLVDTDDSGKGRHFKSRFIQPGLVKIEGHGVVLIKKETLDESLKSMVGSPFIVLHKTITEDNADELRDGVCSTAYYNEADGWYYTEGIIWDKTAQNLITDKGWSVSCSYDVLEINDEGGVENNIPYDKEFTKLNFTHLALVNNPRYERANIVFNAKDFITVGEGESVTTQVGNIKKHEDINVNNIKNNKEQDMALIEEIKKLISRVENNKENEPMTLKDKIISILNSNDVDVDTIEEIEKALTEAEERIDNEKQPEEEKQPEDEKVDNSDEEQKKEEPTEEKKEPKKEEKEQEKVDNAKPDYFEKLNSIYNSANEVKQTTEFKTRQERLEDGKRF